jgi:hypothetical protein
MASDTKTNDLKKLIMTQLKTLTSNVYYEIAADNALYPHIVFSFKMINLGDLWRQDYTLDVDVWDKGQNTTRIDSLCDDIERLLHMQNLPQTGILPTFYLIDRRSIIDEDKSIKHRLVRFQIQNYER